MRPTASRRFPARTTSHSPSTGAGTGASMAATRSSPIVSPPWAIARRASPRRGEQPRCQRDRQRTRRDVGVAEREPADRAVERREDRRVADRLARERGRAHPLGVRDGLGAVRPLGDVARQRPLRAAAPPAARPRSALERLDLAPAQQREPAQVRRRRRGRRCSASTGRTRTATSAPASSQIESPPSVLPNFVPGRRQQQLVGERRGAGLVGVAVGRPSLRSPARRRISSRPAVMLPHWSAPPIWSSTPIVRWRCSKSVAWSSM